MTTERPRRDATDDVELRRAATYNLGMAAAARAASLEAENPEEALDALYEAADWFREAAALDPEAVRTIDLAPQKPWPVGCSAMAAPESRS